MNWIELIQPLLLLVVSMMCLHLWAKLKEEREDIQEMQEDIERKQHQYIDRCVRKLEYLIDCLQDMKKICKPYSEELITMDACRKWLDFLYEAQIECKKNIEDLKEIKKTSQRRIKDNMINIQDIIPFMKDGWVAIDKNGEWYWYPLVPNTEFNREWQCNAIQSTHTLKAFDIAPADDWTKSLIKVG